MPLPFFNKNHTDISNYLDFPGELLNSSASSKGCILIAGPDLVRWEVVPDQGHTDTYLEHLLKGMVVWCTQNKVIQDQDIIHDLHISLHNGALVPLAYRIEEYLAAAQLKEQCLRAVLNPYSQAEAIHYQLTRFPFRGYITTSYDTCIETAYEETQQGQLSKFYQSSLTHAVDASRKKQPFILKLYGDLAEPDSIRLGHRLLTGLYTEDVRQQLRQLLFETPSIFIGFDDADEDLTVLQSLVTDEYNGLQKHSTRARDLPDGITTKPGNQSSSDYTAHEFSPGDRPPGPVISSQSQDITSKDERPEKETTPDTTRREPMSVPASEGQYKGKGTNTGSLQSSSGPPADHDGQNGQPPNQPPKPAASTGDAQLRVLLESHFSDNNLQLPDELPLFKKFKSLLNDLQLSLEVQQAKTRGALPKQYTLVNNTQGNLSRALIYIPGSIMENPAKTESVASLCFAFPKDTFLIICTDAQFCAPQIQHIIEKNWPSNLKKAKIVWRQQIQLIIDFTDSEDKKYWIIQTLELEMGS